MMYASMIITYRNRIVFHIFWLSCSFENSRAARNYMRRKILSISVQQGARKHVRSTHKIFSSLMRHPYHLFIDKSLNHMR